MNSRPLDRKKIRERKDQLEQGTHAPRGSLRALMPALANKTYFNNNPALLKQMLENDCSATGLRENPEAL